MPQMTEQQLFARELFRLLQDLERSPSPAKPYIMKDIRLLALAIKSRHVQ